MPEPDACVVSTDVAVERLMETAVVPGCVTVSTDVWPLRLSVLRDSTVVPGTREVWVRVLALPEAVIVRRDSDPAVMVDAWSEMVSVCKDGLPDSVMVEPETVRVVRLPEAVNVLIDSDPIVMVDCWSEIVSVCKDGLPDSVTVEPEMVRVVSVPEAVNVLIDSDPERVTVEPGKVMVAVMPEAVNVLIESDPERVTVEAARVKVVGLVNVEPGRVRVVGLADPVIVTDAVESDV